MSSSMLTAKEYTVSGDRLSRYINLYAVSTTYAIGLRMALERIQKDAAAGLPIEADGYPIKRALECLAEIEKAAKDTL